jgi:hypothetical protein
MNNLKLKPDKWKFLRKEIICLDRRLTANGLLPDSDKVKAV